MATATTPTTGLVLPCPCCGEPNAEIALRLWRGDFTCTSCDAEFHADAVRAFIARWTPVLKWVEAMPRSQE